MFEVIDSSQVFLLSPSAIERVQSLMEKEAEDVVLRIGVRPGGCSGLSYETYFDFEVNDDDTVIEYGTVTIAIDPESLPYLKGSLLNFYDGLQGGFKIENPNATRTCGCGESFS